MKNYSDRLSENFHHFENLQKIVAKYGFPVGGGSYMMDGKSLDYHRETFEKQEILFEFAKKCKKALEIGNYAGHSLFIMLIASDDILIDANDINWFEFTKPCIDYLNSNFNNRITYYPMNSIDLLPTLSSKYDLIHIDGQHDPTHISAELAYCEFLSHDETFFVIDDIEGAIHGMQAHLHKLNLISRPECLWPNAIYKKIKI
jgi:hypothetical protein